MEAGQADSQPAASAVLITTENNESSVVEGPLERDKHHPNLSSMQGSALAGTKGSVGSVLAGTKGSARVSSWPGQGS